jgi:hypothetical protein
MTRRDKATLRSRIMKKVVMGLVAGSLFFNLPHEQSGIPTFSFFLAFFLFC